jgi:hypothetical protein
MPFLLPPQTLLHLCKTPQLAGDVNSCAASLLFAGQKTAGATRATRSQDSFISVEESQGHPTLSGLKQLSLQNLSASPAPWKFASVR